MTQLLIYLVIGGLSLVGIRYRETRSVEGWFEKQNTDQLRGLCALLIVAHHIATQKFADGLFHQLGYISVISGYLLVGYFFLISGYGLEYGEIYAAKHKKHSLLRRVVTISVPYITISLLYWVYGQYMTEQIGFLDIVTSILEGNPLVKYSWYKFSSIVPYYDDYSTVKWKPTTKNIVFFGALNRVENVKSALWFYENVFCKLKDTSWNLVLLGSHPDEKLVFLSQQDERVIVTGFVKDIRPWLQNCACMIAPLVMGAGIKVKVLEALSAGVPLLTNEIGMEGINAENEKEYFHCQTAEDYIRVLDAFFDSEDKLTTMSIAEKKFVKSNFDKEISYERYRDSLLHIAGKK